MLSWLDQIARFQPLFEQLVVIFSLVLTRVSGLMLAAPIFGARETPVRVRALLAFSIALLVLPTQLAMVIDRPSDLATLAISPDQNMGAIDWGTDSGRPENLINYLVVVANETTIGLALGTAVMLLFVGVQAVGQVVSQMSGMAMANSFDPTLQTQVPVLSQMLRLLALAIFVIAGGHRLLMKALLDTFQVIPLGGPGIGASLSDSLITVLTQAFTFGIRAAAPIMMSLLLSVLVLGLIGRTLPQLNILAIGFGINSMVMLMTVSLSIGTFGWLFHEQIQLAIDTVTQGIYEAAADI